MKTDLRLIEEKHPLVHNITNYVAMNMVANSIIKECHPSVIKGNANEIKALYTHHIGNVSIDSLLDTQEVETVAKQLANDLDCVIVVSGSKDIITAFLAVNPIAFDAALHAMQTMGLVGKRAGAMSKENGSMMVNFLNELSNLIDG